MITEHNIGTPYHYISGVDKLVYVAENSPEAVRPFDAIENPNPFLKIGDHIKLGHIKDTFIKKTDDRYIAIVVLSLRPNA